MKDEPTYQPITPEQEEQKENFPNPVGYKEGKYRTTFQSPFDQYAHRIGHKFEVLRQLTLEEADEEVGPMFKIRFEDGAEIDAWPEEICEWET